MNAVEIEEAVSALAEAPFESAEFPYQFLEAFGNKPNTLKRLRAGATNQSDLPGGVLQRNNIHLIVCRGSGSGNADVPVGSASGASKAGADGDVGVPAGADGDVGVPMTVTAALDALRDSPATTKHKAKFLLATDGRTVEAENLEETGETLVCDYADLGDRFAFFLRLAGITTVRQIRENAFDIKATGRLNRLYVELLKTNPDWDTADRRHDLNHFFARLIFCFFAEDTHIFRGDGLFTATVEQMSAGDSSNTHDVLAEIFRAMDVKPDDREAAKVKSWADAFPYVNGGLFGGASGSAGAGGGVPRFSRIARSYLLHVGRLDWTRINPDIFGSMIQAVADDAERGALGMHYTSVPNILKVLNPLFLDDLRARLDEAGESPIKLLNLRKRLARIRVFDPACGSGNFLVIAYKEMRGIEAAINARRGEADRPSDVPPTNFRGIELRHFSAEIARLALIIAKFQCDVLHRGPQLALAEFLPLEAANWITCGNALRLDWLSVCPPTGTNVKGKSDDLFETPLDQVEMDFENEGGETYICGNPPYVGRRNQTKEQKIEIKEVLGKIKSAASLDYVFCWIEKASQMVECTEADFAFVTTNSVAQGTQIPIFWPHLLMRNQEIFFAHESFKWSNNAANNAGVTCVVIGVGRPRQPKYIFSHNERRTVDRINPYLIPSDVEIVVPSDEPIGCAAIMKYGNMPADGNHLTITKQERDELISNDIRMSSLIRPLYGAQEFIRGIQRYCLWIDDDDLDLANSNAFVSQRIELVRKLREAGGNTTYKAIAHRPHQFSTRNMAADITILAPTISSESRPYLPTDIFPGGTGTTNQAYALYDAPLWNMALIASRLHLVWIATVCGKLETRYRYSNTLGWNTFPVPALTEQNKADLTGCAEGILLAREAFFPATIADLYDPAAMPAELRAAHERNDETLERIYVGRRFRNDTERLETLFRMYTELTARRPGPPAPAAKPAKRPRKAKA